MTEIFRHAGRRGAILLLLVLLIAVTPFGLGLMLNLPSTGSNTYEKAGAVVDLSNTSQGYIMVKRQCGKRQKLRVTKDKKTYDYDINGEGNFDVIPLQMGSGTYTLALYEQKSGTQYSAKFKDKKIDVKLDDENICYTYPNQYVNYDADTKAVALADELCAGLTGDKEKYSAIAGYIKSSIVYDYMKAVRVVGDQLTVYLPAPDDTLEERMGICFDFAALSACMLRSQGVATKLVIGLADKQYHAWNEVLIEGKWARSDLTFAVTNTKIDSDKYVTDRVY